MKSAICGGGLHIAHPHFKILNLSYIDTLCININLFVIPDDIYARIYNLVHLHEILF